MHVSFLSNWSHLERGNLIIDVRHFLDFFGPMSVMLPLGQVVLGCTEHASKHCSSTAPALTSFSSCFGHEDPFS